MGGGVLLGGMVGWGRGLGAVQRSGDGVRADSGGIFGGGAAGDGRPAVPAGIYV